MKAFSYLKVGLITTGNIVAYAASSGRFLWLEGRVRGGVFRTGPSGFATFAGQFDGRPREDEIVDLVRAATSLRVFGSGHSFNDGVVSDDVLVSLDHFTGLVAVIWTGSRSRCGAVPAIRDVVDCWPPRAGVPGPAVPRRAEHRRHLVDRRARHR